MLVLSRAVGEKIRIGEDTVIEVLKMKGREVRLGITAPKSVRVDREEVYELRKAKEVRSTTS